MRQIMNAFFQIASRPRQGIQIGKYSRDVRNRRTDTICSTRPVVLSSVNQGSSYLACYLLERYLFIVW
jgi:hypothetical protein